MIRWLRFILLVFTLCSAACELPDESKEKKEQELFSRHDIFMQWQLLTELRQLEMMVGNEYHYFDSLTLRGKIAMSFMDSLMLFKQSVHDAENRILGMRSNLISEYEGIPAWEADTLRTSMITNLDVRVNISDDTVTVLDHLLESLEQLGNGLPHKKATARSRVSLPEFYDHVNGTAMFWGYAAFKNVSLEEALQSLDALRLHVARYELEILMRVRAGVENAHWDQN